MTWDATLQFSYNKNKVTDLNYTPTINAVFQGSPLTGQPVGYIAVNRYGGLDEYGDPTFLYEDGGEPQSYLDLDMLTIDDLKFVGRTEPPVFGSLTSSLRWRDFTLSLMVNYKFALGNFTLSPGIGVVGSFGMAGSSEQEYEYSDFQTGEKTMLTDRYRVFGDFDSRTGQGGYLRRADIGLRGSVHAGWKRVSIGIAYTVGFMNLANTGEKGVYPDGTVIKDFGTLTISAGFSF